MPRQIALTESIELRLGRVLLMGSFLELREGRHCVC
jgi:hypothetical protein